MGRNEQGAGIYAREASILVAFQWEGRRHRERLALRPTPANLKAAARLRVDIVAAINLGRFTIDDFREHFPDSPFLKKVGTQGGETFEMVADTWLTIAGQELQATTIKEYDNTLKRHWLPKFGQRRIDQISYEEMALHLAAQKFKTAKTFNNVMTPARRIFEYAVKTGRLKENVTSEISGRSPDKAAPDPLEPREIDLFLDRLREKKTDAWLNYFEFAFFSGLRPSELIAVKWGDVDFVRRLVTVSGARVRGLDKTTKTKGSQRDVDLQSRAMIALMRQKKHTFMAGEFVFMNPATGRRIWKSGTPLAEWHAGLKAAGLHDRGAKQTRHTFATICLHAGVNPAYVARQMGHVDTRMFFAVYSKWINGSANDREIAKLDAMFGKVWTADAS